MIEVGKFKARTCSGVSRRSFLKLGASVPLGLSLAGAGAPVQASEGQVELDRMDMMEGMDIVLDGPPLKLSQTPGYVAAPGPLLGEHTDSVLSQLLDYSAEQIAQLKEDRVIASHAEIHAERAERE